jgi:hypothetical protein
MESEDWKRTEWLLRKVLRKLERQRIERSRDFESERRQEDRHDKPKDLEITCKEGCIKSSGIEYRVALIHMV